MANQKDTTQQAYNEALGQSEQDDIFAALERTYCIKNKKPVPENPLTTKKWQDWVDSAAETDRRAWVMDAYNFALWLIENKAEKEVNTNKKFTLTMPQGFEELSLVIVFIVGDDGRFDKDGILMSETNARVSNSPYPTLTLGSILSAFSMKEGPTFDEAVKGAWGAWSLYQEEYLSMCPDARNPFGPSVEAYVLRPRTIETASTTQAEGAVRIPYRTSEVLRRNWKPFDGDVKAIIVDGEPLAARMTDITSPSKGKKARIYTPNAQGQMTLAISTRRQPDQKPVPLIAFEQFSGDLRSPIATDVAILMTVAHASNQDIRLTSAEGARFLARGRDGKARTRIRDTDKQRFEVAFGALHGTSEWVLCPDGIYRLYPLIRTDRINDDVVEFGPPTWAKNERGPYTLSGAFGQASAGRLIGGTSDGGLWRTIAGVEYWLARSPATWSKAKKRMIGPAKTLLPASGKTGPGEWQKIEWRQLLILSGECWDPADEREDAKARQRYKRRIERLQGYGTEKTKSGKRVKKKIYPSYFTPSLGSAPAEAGDTVEFHQSKRGYINVRATERFVAGAELASKSQFEIMRLAEFMGI